MEYVYFLSLVRTTVITLRAFFHAAYAFVDGSSVSEILHFDIAAPPAEMLLSL